MANHNCGSGINGGPGWKVSHNVTNDDGYGGVVGSKGNGISLVGNNAIIDGNVADRNGGQGLAGEPGNGYLVTNNEASNNEACGLFLSTGIGSGFSNDVFLSNTINQLCGNPSFRVPHSEMGRRTCVTVRVVKGPGDNLWRFVFTAQWRKLLTP